MKKIVLFVSIIILSAYVSDAGNYRLKLRASYHREFLRIVLEGPESVISGAIVNQKARNIQVVLPGSSFTIEEQKVMVAYKKTAEDTIMFFPLEFSGFKVFTLEYPSRLVIDVYGEKQKEKDISKTERWEYKKEEKPSGVMSVVIDPGHGGYESGLVADDYREKNVVLDIAKRLKARISRGAGKCFLTRESDRFLGLGQRVKYANGKNADIFLSLHIGNHEKIVIYVPMITGTVPDNVKPFLLHKGQEDFMAETFSLLKAVKKAIAADFGEDSLSVRPLPYSMLSKIETAAIIIELPSFKDAYYIPELRTEVANTLYKGIYMYEENTAK